MRAAILVVALLLPACASASKPKPFTMPLELADTARVSVTCPVAGPNTGCLVSAVDSISGRVLWANQSMTVGETITTAFTGAPGSRVVIKGTMVGVAPGVGNSAPSFARAEGVFPLPDAQVPVFTIQLQFIRP